MNKNKNSILAMLALICVVSTPSLAQDQLTGMFRMVRTPVDAVGAQLAEALSDTFAPDEALRWQMFVPESYNPDRPPGVFIYLDPNGYGGLPDQWRMPFENHNLIWVGPNNNRPRAGELVKLWHAIFGLRVVEQEYLIDRNRIYIGSLGNTALTSINMQQNRSEFNGAIYMLGSYMWQSLEPERLEMLRRNRHVFITGATANARAQVRSDADNYRNAGINDVKLVYDTQRIGKLPDPDHIEEAIRFLDGG